MKGFCDIQKRTMITFGLVAITLITGFAGLADGQEYNMTITTSNIHDKSELKKMQQYCIDHADRAANGEAVVNDLVKAGLVDSQYYDMPCSNIEQLLQTCTAAFIERFGREPFYAYEFSICPKINK